MNLSCDKFLLCSCLVLSMIDLGVLFGLHLCLSFEFAVSRGNSIYADFEMNMETGETGNL